MAVWAQRERHSLADCTADRAELELVAAVGVSAGDRQTLATGTLDGSSAAELGYAWQGCTCLRMAFDWQPYSAGELDWLHDGSSPAVGRAALALWESSAGSLQAIVRLRSGEISARRR